MLGSWFSTAIGVISNITFTSKVSTQIFFFFFGCLSSLSRLLSLQLGEKKSVNQIRIFIKKLIKI